MIMTIADRIRNRRLELGLSVDDLAELLNKNRATVYRYESNYIKTYSADVIESLAKALQTTPAYFYGFDDVVLSSSPVAILDADDQEFLSSYRSLTPSGKEYLRQQIRAARLMFNETKQEE